MTAHRDLKDRIRARQRETGESYTAARAHLMRERAELLGIDESDAPARAHAAVLNVGERSARLRILGEEGQVTFRSRDVYNIVPGHIVTLVIEKRWTWHGDAYASGRIESPRIDIPKLELKPLPLEGGELTDITELSDPSAVPDTYHQLEEQFAPRPRPSYEFDEIAFGELPGMTPMRNPTLDAAECIEEGKDEAARELLMEALLVDLRCLDAHALLGNLEFDLSPNRAMLHYEVGVRIGELSLPAGFDGFLLWGCLYNRPFLRCLYGLGLCHWQLGRNAEASRVFDRMLVLNPTDNQGARFCLQDIHAGKTWKECV